MLPVFYFSILLGAFTVSKFLGSPERIVSILSKIMFWIYPCLIFTSVTHHFDRAKLIQSIHLPIFTFIILAVGYAIGKSLAPKVSRSQKSKSTFVFMSTVPNYIFLPMTIIQPLWGSEAVSRLILTTLGSDLFLWTLGVGTFSRRSSWWRSLINPPFITMITSILIVAIEIDFLIGVGHLSYPILSPIGQMTVPLSIIILGLTLGRTSLKEFDKSTAALVGLRLIFIPALGFLCLPLLPIPSLDRNILFLICTMPAALATLVITEIFNGDTEYAARGVFATHLCGAFTIPIWCYFFF